MTQDEIIHMAQEAGFIPNGQAERAWLERFAALVAAHAKSEQINLAYQQGYEDGSAHEREACAKVCESYLDGDNPHTYGITNCAAAIRARGNK